MAVILRLLRLQVVVWRGKPKKTMDRRIRLPPEILHLIFEHLHHDSLTFTRGRLLLPLLLVCKNWHDVALRRLYASVSLGGEWSRSVPEGGEDKMCEKLLGTILENPKIAPLVRELRLGTGRSVYRTIKDTSRHAQLLRLCKNVERLEISGHSKDRWKELKGAAEEADLVEFTLSQVLLGREEGDLCSQSDILTCLLSWPRLRKLKLHNVHHRANDTRILPSPSSAKRRCPWLIEIKIMDGHFDPKHLLILSEMAPNVEIMSYISEWGRWGQTDEQLTDALQTCLRRWSSTLTHLTLLDQSVSNSVAAVCPSLENLCFLFVHSSAISPDALVNFTHLKHLCYHTTVAHCHQLELSLQNKSMLRSLRRLILFPATSISDPEEMDRFYENATTVRRICMDRDVDYLGGIKRWTSSDPYVRIQPVQIHYV